MPAMIAHRYSLAQRGTRRDDQTMATSGIVRFWHDEDGWGDVTGEP
jgi:hypothetical protein